MPGYSALKTRPHVFDFQHAHQKRTQFKCSRRQRECTRAPLKIVRKQGGIMMHHRRAGSGRADNHFGFALFADFDETLGHASRIGAIASIESRLPAASLALVKLAAGNRLSILAIAPMRDAWPSVSSKSANRAKPK